MKRKWLILLIVALSVGLTFFLTGNQPDVYLATAKLATGIVDNPDDDGRYTDPKKIDMRFNNLINNLNSRTVVSQLSYKLLLHDLDHPADAFRNTTVLTDRYSKEEIADVKAYAERKQDSIAAITNKEQDRTLNDMLKALGYDYNAIRDSLKASRQKDADYIAVEFRSGNPELAAFAANELCLDFIRYQKSDKAQREETGIEKSTSQVDEKLKALNDRMEELKKFKVDNNIMFDIYARQAEIMTSIKDYELMYQTEIAKIPGYKSRIHSLTRTNDEIVETAKREQELNRQISNLRKQIEYMNNKYISGGNRDKELAAQIDKVKAEQNAAIAELASLTKQAAPNIQIEMEGSEEGLAIAQGTVAQIEQKLKSLREEQAILFHYQPKVDEMEAKVEQAKEEWKEAQNKLGVVQTEAFHSENKLKQAEAAVTPREPEPTKQLFFSLFSGMLSLSFCIVLFFVLEYVDVSIKTPAQFERFTNLRLLGYLNQINFISFNLDVNFIDINLESIFHNKNQNAQLETFKQLIRKIRFEIESTDAKRFLFTSTRENEGKTFAMISLAYTLSLNNKKVLLIDTNFKNNTLTNMLSAKPSLEKHFNQSLVKEDIISKSKLKGIDVIGCYEGNYSPSEVFSQSNFHNLVNDLAQHYDFIFMEGAALNEYSDSKELISSVEKVISVFSTNATIKDQDKASIAYLRGLGDKFMGAVLNKVDVKNLN